MPRQDPEASATITSPLLCAKGEIPEKGIPVADLSVLNNGLRTIRIIKNQDFGLHEGITCAATRRMFRVSLRVSPPASPPAPPSIAGKRKKRAAWNQLFGLTNIRNDGPERLPGASSDTRQCDRCAHQLQETVTAKRIEPFGRASGNSLAKSLQVPWLSPAS